MLYAYPAPLVPGTLLRRYKRFLADIKLQTGETVTAHCANPGAMLGLNGEGARVWLSKSDNPKRKLKYSWELVEVDLGAGSAMVGINTVLPNTLAAAALAAGAIPSLAGYDEIRREVPYGTNSRIDFLLTQESGAGAPKTRHFEKTCHVEVKNVHLMREAGVAEFPDCVTTRGAKHLNELAKIVDAGGRAVMLYLIQRDDAQSFQIAGDLDPGYLSAFRAAREAGVEALAYACPPTLSGFESLHEVAVVEPSKAPETIANVAHAPLSP